MKTEHLYRDDVGAAAERMKQLEEENARLRDELDQVTSPRVRPSRGRRSIAPYLMLVTMTLAMLSSLVASGGHGHVRPHAPGAPAVSSPCRP